MTNKLGRGRLNLVPFEKRKKRSPTGAPGNARTLRTGRVVQSSLLRFVKLLDESILSFLEPNWSHAHTISIAISHSRGTGFIFVLFGFFVFVFFFLFSSS